MRRLLFLCLIACLLVAGPAAVAEASSDGSLSAAAYNKKKCKKAKTKKQKKKYCKKKKAPQQQQGGGTTTQQQQGGGTTSVTEQSQGGGTTQPTDPNAVVRDDAGFTDALVGSKLKKTSEGTYGYGEYTWNFCAGGAWSYRSYYYAGSTVESNDGGSYQVVEGYHAAADPNYYAGVVQVTTTSGKQYRFGVELRGAGGFMKTNVKDFEEGNFGRTAGAATC